MCTQSANPQQCCGYTNCTQPELVWRKSSYSSANGCASVAMPEPDRILVRDDKDPDGPVLRFTAHEWDAFVAGVKAGEFDRPGK